MALIQGIVDTQKQNLKSLGIVNSGDDLTIELEVKQNGVNIEFVNPIFELLATKSDGTRVRQLVDITYIGNVVNIIADEQLVTSPGIVTLQLIIKDNKRNSTCLFYLMCGTSLDRDIIQSIDKVGVLHDLDEYVVQAFVNLKEYEQRIIAGDTSIRKLNSDMTAAEKARETAEINRGNTFDNLVLRMNEAIKAAIATDETLQNNETKRIDNYNTLKTELESIKDDLILLNNNISKEEEKRVQAEIDRVNDSIKTINTLNTTNDNVADAEAIRVLDWSSIKQENTTLKEALTTINNTANSNEEVRKENEAGRVSAEQKRQNDFETMQQENTTFKEEVKTQYDNIVTENNNFKNQMNTDFGEAKIGYDGTTHNNIVERLNYDFDRIEQKHNESSYLEYSGTSVKADNSYYGLSKDLCIKGRTIQNLMNESVMGISKFTKYSNTTIEDNSDYLTINRGTTELKVSTVLDGTMLKPNTTYTIILSQKDNNTYVQVYDSNSSTFLLKPINSNKVTFTTKNTTNLLYLYFLNINSNDVQSIKVYKNSVMILEGDYSNISTDELSYGVGVYSVGEKENNLIGVKTCGKNLFRYEDVRPRNSLSVVEYGDNSVTITDEYFCGSVIKVKRNTRYYVSATRTLLVGEKGGQIAIFKSDGKSVQGYVPIKSIGGKDGWFDSEDNEYISFLMYGGSASVGTCKFSNVQLEEIKNSETTGTDYFAPRWDAQNIQLEAPLRSLPNGICDELYNIELIRRIGVFIADEKISYSTTSHVPDTENYYKFYFHIPKRKINYKIDIGLLCNNIPVVDQNQRNNDELLISVDGWNKNVYFSIKKSKLTSNTIEALKQYLQQNPITVYYELETPIITKLDKTIQLKIFNETTHITSDNYLQPNLSVKVPTNVPKVIQNLKIENRSLESELNKANNLILENAEYNLDNDLRITKYELGL